VQSSLHLKSAVVVFAAVASLGRVGATQDEKVGALPDTQTYAKQIRVLEHEVRNLESQVRRLRDKNQQLESTQARLLEESGDVGVVLFLFGVFCALWAQNTGRSSWLWFFAGLFFSVIAVLVLLWKNANDKVRQRAFSDGPARPRK